MSQWSDSIPDHLLAKRLDHFGKLVEIELEQVDLVEMFVVCQ